VFCDIEKTRTCPAINPQTGLPILPNAIPLSHGAVALNLGETSNQGLDYSPDAKARCGGNPEVVTFVGSFPEGYPVCLNCFAVFQTNPDFNAVCVAQCEDRPDDGSGSTSHAYCVEHARVSTNAPVDDCFLGACTLGGLYRQDYRDPRRNPEAVLWQDLKPSGGLNAIVHIEPFGVPFSELTRTAPTTGTTTDDFNAGAASTQWITRGDGYVEFAAAETTLSHVVGLSLVPAGCTSPAACPDGDPHLTDMDFSIGLQSDGRVYVLERATLVPRAPGVPDFGTYGAGERFRLGVKDNLDGTATISYLRVIGACTPGAPCPVVPFELVPGIPLTRGPVPYPFRVDASFREQGAMLTAARIVRMK
jgi:hypothetical protein